MEKRNKDYLIQKVRKDHKVSLVDAEIMVNAVLGEMVNIVAELPPEGRFIIRGFGAFHVRQSKERMARNPKTGEEAVVSERMRVSFRAGKGLKKAVNQ